jgi:hypothetical protein
MDKILTFGTEDLGFETNRVHYVLIPPQHSYRNKLYVYGEYGAPGSVVGWGTLLQAGFADSIPDEVIGFFNRPNPSSNTMALGLTQPLTEISTRNLPRGKGRPALKADNLTAIYEPIV